MRRVGQWGDHRFHLVTKVLIDAFPGVFTRHRGVQATKGCGSSLEITLGYDRLR